MKNTSIKGLTWMLLLALAIGQTMLTQERNLILMLTNEARANVGMLPLILDTHLNHQAQLHAQDMLVNKFLSQQSMNGSTPSERAGETVGINIGRKFNMTMNDMFDGWMKNPKYRANILNGTYARLGVGVYRQNLRLYSVLLFGMLKQDNPGTDPYAMPTEQMNPYPVNEGMDSNALQIPTSQIEIPASTPSQNSVPTQNSFTNDPFSNLPADNQVNPTNVEPNPVTPSTTERVAIAIFPGNEENMNPSMPDQSVQNIFFAPIINQIYTMISGAQNIVDSSVQNSIQKWVDMPDDESWPFNHLFESGICCMVSAYRMETTIAEYGNISSYVMPTGSKKIGVGITLNGSILTIWVITVL